jgi:hypothetical protein
VHPSKERKYQYHAVDAPVKTPIFANPKCREEVKHVFSTARLPGLYEDVGITIADRVH